MARVKRGVHAKKSHKAILDRAKGFRGARSRRFKVAKEAVYHAERYAYRDRRARKGDFRQLWITRINAQARAEGLSYSRFMHGLKLAEVEVDRKVLADLAVRDQAAFGALVATAKAALEAGAAAPAGDAA
jgi:large subunit ribosomal protein L20